MNLSALKSKIVSADGAALLLIAAINIGLTWHYWTGATVFSGKDFLALFYPLLNFQSDCLQDGSLPLWNPFMNFGYPYVEHFVNSMFFPSHLLMGLVTGSSLVRIQQELLSWIIIGGWGVYFFARERGHARTTSIITAVSYMFCGQMLQLPQWNSFVYNAACFPFLLLGYERAKRRSAALSLLSVAFLAMTILGGYLPATVLGIYLFGLFVLIDAAFRRDFLFAARYLAVTGGAAVVLALPKLIPLYAAMDSGPRLAAAGLSKDPFNAVTFYQFISYILPVKFYFSLYIGTAAIAGGVYAMLGRRVRFDSLALLAFISAWLLLSDVDGNLSLLRHAANILPLMPLVRNEWLYWFYPSLFAILFLAGHLDAFLAGQWDRYRLLTGTILLILAAVLFVTAYDVSAFLTAFVTQSILIVLWTAVTAVPAGRLRSAGAIVLVTAEFIIFFNRVSVDRAPEFRDNGMIVAAADQTLQDRSFGTSAEYNRRFHFFILPDAERPRVIDAVQRPFLISGLDGDPTYNMYPEQFGKGINYMNYKFFTGWWYNVQEEYPFIRIKDSPLLTALDRQPIAELRSSAPGQHPGTGVTFDGLSCTNFTFTVHADSPSILLLRQIYDERWSVLSDSRRLVPTQTEESFMAIPVEPGTHRITFVFRDPRFIAATGISAVVLALLIALRLRSYRKALHASAPAKSIARSNR